MTCLQVFPDDARIAAAMDKIPNTKPLTPEQVRIFLKNDPGRGWIASNNGVDIVVTIEAPPVHACAVRMPRTNGAIDEPFWWQAVEEAERRAGSGFTRMPTRSVDIGDSRSIATGSYKNGPDGAYEAFYLFRTAPIDPKMAAQHGVELRMVHQIVAAKSR